MDVSTNQDLIMWTTIVVGTTTSALAAVGATWGQLRAAKYNRLALEEDKKNQRELRYDNLTRQYLDTKAKLPVGFRRRPLEQTLNGLEEEAARDMVSLFCKEHRSFVTQSLGEEEWEEFKTGMANFGLSPHGGRIWGQMRDDPHAELPERFRVFYNKFLDEERERRTAGKINGHFPANMKDTQQPIEIGAR